MVEEAKSKVTEIAKVLYHSKPSSNIGLLSGVTGQALFFHEYYAYNSDIRYIHKRDSLIETAVDLVYEQAEHSATYATGLAGFASGLRYIYPLDMISDILDPSFFQEIDYFLLNCLRDEASRGNFDFLHGSVGICWYFLFSKDSELVHKSINILLRELEGQLVVRGNGVAWKKYAKGQTQNFYDLGLSHGVPAILVILCKISLIKDFKKRAHYLISGVLTLMENSMLDPKQYYSFFPYSVDNNNSLKTGSRLAWCYGDLGVCCALWTAYETTKNLGIKNLVENILDFSCQRMAKNDNSVFDASFCHGSAGIGFIFLFFYKKYSKQVYLDTARYWYEQTLSFAVYPDSPTGYKTFSPTEEDCWQNEDNLIEGVTGVGLSLLSLLNQRLSWGKLLLVN